MGLSEFKLTRPPLTASQADLEKGGRNAALLA